MRPEPSVRGKGSGLAEGEHGSVEPPREGRRCGERARIRPSCRVSGALARRSNERNPARAGTAAVVGVAEVQEPHRQAVPDMRLRNVRSHVAEHRLGVRARMRRVPRERFEVVEDDRHARHPCLPAGCSLLMGESGIAWKKF